MKRPRSIRLCLFSLCVCVLTSHADILRLELPGPSYPIPLKIYLPGDIVNPAPVVLVSHGLGGSREGSTYLGEHWSAAGYVVVAIQHPGSDESVWKDAPKLKRMDALKKAANGQSFMARISDVGLVLDYLESSLHSATHPLYQRVDPSRIAMSGHSFGAVTSQAIMGQSFRQPSDAAFFSDRIDCVILMSPSQSKGLSNESAFGSVTLPVLCMTGTEDGSPLQSEVTPESRREVYASLPEGQAYQVVFDEGVHSIFSDRHQDRRYHSPIEIITTAFLDAHLKQDSEALDWLRSDEVSKSLAPEDEWEWK
jgi:predicted dienelactone hydrolase